MLKFIKTHFGEYYLDIILWVICVVIISTILYPIIVNKIISGWDLVSHYYLVTQMVDSLKDFSITSYDTSWFAGYPVFTFYGPLPYILISLIYFILFGLIPLPLVFNTFLFLLPFLFLISIYYSSRAWFGNKVGPFSLFFGLLFLLLGKEYDVYGIGIGAEMYLGLFSNLFAITLMVFLLGVLSKIKHKNNIKTIILSSILLSSIILSHSLTTIFTGIILCILIISDWKKYFKPIIKIFLLSLLITSFWLIPFLLNINYSSGYEIGVLQLTNDPLFIIFPKINEIIQKPGIGITPGLLLFICSFIGILKLTKTKKHFWPLAFLFTLIFLPRDYLIYVFDLPIHYYRFISYIFVLNIFIAAYGLYYIFKKILALNPFPKLISKITFFYVFFLTIGIVFYLNFNLFDNYNFYFEDYPQHEVAEEILNYINELEPTGRVAVESQRSNQFLLGTPHYFFDFLPIKYDIDVLPGLLAESALSSEFIIPTIAIMSDSLAWGRPSLRYDYQFINEDIESKIKRLSMYNVEYFLLSKNYADYYFSDIDENLIRIEKEIGNYSIYNIIDYYPKLMSTTYKPFLFINKGGIDFRKFCSEWFKYAEMLDYPVIYTSKSFDEISDYDKSNLGGLIISYPKDYKLSELELENWKNLDIKIIFLNVSSNYSDKHNIKYVSSFNTTEGIEFFVNLFLDFAITDYETDTIKPIVIDDEYLKFDSDKGTYINYSYFPRWGSKDPDQTIFWATPSMMFVFGKGETELYYD